MVNQKSLVVACWYSSAKMWCWWYFACLLVTKWALLDGQCAYIPSNYKDRL